MFSGGWGDESIPRNKIIVWLEEKQEWEEIGKMKIGRAYHAVDTIQMEDQAMEHCC